MGAVRLSIAISISLSPPLLHLAVSDCCCSLVLLHPAVSDAPAECEQGPIGMRAKRGGGIRMKGAAKRERKIIR